jgi:ribokinase
MVVVFGSINLDLVARVPRIPSPGETLAGSSFITAPGGKGANQALAARDAGAAVAMYGAVGRDAFAGPALANLVAAGVDIAGVARVDGPTGVALINVDSNGENAITVVAGANAYARAAQVPDDRLTTGNTLLMQLETDVREVAELAARARHAGGRVVLNAAPASPLPDTLTRNLDVLIVNEVEAAVCAAAFRPALSPDAWVERMQSTTGMTVVLTLGARGAAMRWNGALRHEAPPAVDVIDTTGAGDALAGALAAALDRGATLPEALAAGVHAGAFACTHAGAQHVRR